MLVSIAGFIVSTFGVLFRALAKRGPTARSWGRDIFASLLVLIVAFFSFGASHSIPPPIQSDKEQLTTRRTETLVTENDRDEFVSSVDESSITLNIDEPLEIEGTVSDVKNTPLDTQLERIAETVVTEVFTSIDIEASARFTSVSVEKVFDAGTFDVVLDGKREKVRLDHIVIPEYRIEKPEFYSREAFEFLKDKIEGRAIYIDTDYERDKFNRLLTRAWINPPENEDNPTDNEISENMVNAILIKEGCAKTAGHLSLLADWNIGLLPDLQKEAQSANKGIWQKRGRTTQQVETVVYITKTGEKYHRDGCSSLRRSQIPINLSDARS
jgi:endonuclease YncB( thermonuclease family)